MTTLWLGAVLYIASAFMVGSAAAATDGCEAIGAPTRAVGESWVYKTAKGQYTKTVVAVAGGNYTITHSDFPGAKFVGDQNLSIQEIQGDFPLDKRITVGWKHIDFPMSPGKKLTYRVEGSRGWFKIDLTGGECTSLKTPMGNIRVLVVASCWTNETSGWYGCGMKHWYSPDLKEFVKRETPSGWLQALRDNDFDMVSTTVVPNEAVTGSATK